MAIGDGWVNGAWVDAGWTSGAWEAAGGGGGGDDFELRLRDGTYRRRLSWAGAAIALLLGGCVQGVTPTDIPPQETKLGRSDSISITVRIKNPLKPDSTDG